jgi:hypothetical protein
LGVCLLLLDLFLLLLRNTLILVAFVRGFCGADAAVVGLVSLGLRGCQVVNGAISIIQWD